MYVTYVVYNLDDGHDLDIIGIHKDKELAVKELNEMAGINEDTLEYGFDLTKDYGEIINENYDRAYGYQLVKAH